MPENIVAIVAEAILIAILIFAAFPVIGEALPVPFNIMLMFGLIILWVVFFISHLDLE